MITRSSQWSFNSLTINQSIIENHRDSVSPTNEKQIKLPKARDIEIGEETIP